jgi:Na+-driven multidrug efflux pump
VGNLIIQAFVNQYGSEVIAGYSSAIKLNTFALTMFGAFSTALASYVAQNFGANKIERISGGIKACMGLSLLLVVPITIAYTFFGDKMMLLFVNGDALGVIQVGQTFLHWAAPFYIVVTTKVIFDSALRGAAAMKYFMITTFADLILRIVFAGLFQPAFGSTGIWMAWPFGWICGMVLSLIFYFKCDWRKHHIQL